MPEDETEERHNPYPKIEEIAIALTGLPASLSRSLKKTRKDASRRLIELTDRMREEISWLEDDENYEEWIYLSDGLRDYEDQLKYGKYREAEITARRLLEYARGV